MRTWQRVGVPATLCGGCNRVLSKGDPVLVIDLVYRGGKTVRRLRCEHCDGPAPPDLPARIERSTDPTPRPLMKIKPLLPFGTPLA